MSWEGNRTTTASLQAPSSKIKLILAPGSRFLVLLISIFTFMSTNVHSSSLDEGNTFLKNGDYDKAVESYEAIVKEGYVGHELFFNLATAYSKKGNVPYAILNFEKALRMKPMDEATEQQLIQLNLKLQDNPVIYDDTGLLAFINRVQFSLSVDAWAFLSIFLMLLVAVVIFISYKFKTLKSRKWIFMSSILWFVLSGFSVLMARNNYHHKYLHTEAVVMNESAVVYDQSNTSSKINFSVHQGTKLEISDSTATMFQVEYSGDDGWILREAVKKIEL
jgi:tetratricopeptide (TPR) repeat protein